LIAVALTAVAWGQQPVRPRTDTDLQPCLDTAACETLFTNTLSETLVEMGFLFQHDGQGASAIVGKGNGFVVELNAQTPAFGDPNILLDEVNLPPVIPRLEVGYQVGSYTYDDPYPQFAASAYAFPPIRLGDYSTFSVGGTGSVSVPLTTHFVWAGAEVDVSYGAVGGPFVGDGDVIDDIDLVSSFVDVQTPACDATSDGCIDRFRTVTVMPRLGFSLEPHPVVYAYGKLGIGYTGSAIDVAYDASGWALRGVQTQFSYGGGARFGDRVQIGVGGVTALKPEALSTDESRAMTRLVASFSVRTGDARYWYDDEAEDSR
jgi:hypothetical protein